MAINHYDQFILCMVFCEKIKWIDAHVLICDRMYFWQQMIWTISLMLLWWRLLAMSSTRRSRSAVSQSAKHKVARLMADQLIADHVIGDRKCMEKWNTVDQRSILNIKLIRDQQIRDQIWFDWRWKNRTLNVYHTKLLSLKRLVN